MTLHEYLELAQLMVITAAIPILLVWYTFWIYVFYAASSRGRDAYVVYIGACVLIGLFGSIQ